MISLRTMQAFLNYTNRNTNPNNNTSTSSTNLSLAELYTNMLSRFPINPHLSNSRTIQVNFAAMKECFFFQQPDGDLMIGFKEPTNFEGIESLQGGVRLPRPRIQTELLASSQNDDGIRMTLLEQAFRSYRTLSDNSTTPPPLHRNTPLTSRNTDPRLASAQELTDGISFTRLPDANPSTLQDFRSEIGFETSELISLNNDVRRRDIRNT